MVLVLEAQSLMSLCSPNIETTVHDSGAAIESHAGIGRIYLQTAVHTKTHKPKMLRVKACAQLAFMEDTREQYTEMRDEFFASLEDRRYLSIAEARKKRLQARPELHGCKSVQEVDFCMHY